MKCTKCKVKNCSIFDNVMKALAKGKTPETFDTTYCTHFQSKESTFTMPLMITALCSKETDVDYVHRILNEAGARVNEKVTYPYFRLTYVHKEKTKKKK